MNYTEEAKDLYEAFHDAMGNWERIPFERLSTREILAWQTATGLTVRLQDQIDEALEESRALKFELDEALDNSAETEAELAHATLLIERLRTFKIGVHFNIGECK